jgi:uncharacterized OsmC-like protein
MSINVTFPTPAQISQAVANVVGKIQENEAAANATFSARSSLVDGLKADISIRGFSLVSDEPESLGGSDLGPNPVEIVLGALGACQEIVIKAYASVLGIPVSSVTVEAHGHLNLKGFFNLGDERPGFESVDFTTRIETTETDAEKLAQLKFFAENRCPVLDIIKNPTVLNGNVQFHNPVLN